MSEFDEYNIIPKRFIDLKNSELDKEKSDPEKYVYVFKHKVYFDKKDNKPPFGYLKWARKTKHLQSGGILTKRSRYGYFPVNVEEHQCLPEPFDISNIDENGHIVYVDALLCAVPYEKLAKKRYREVTRSDRDLRATFSNFDDALKESNAELDPEEREKLKAQRDAALGL
jgi:hypothetical protein